MENHDRAYAVWREAGVRDRILVHIDAHADMWWTDGTHSLSIANFICPALNEGLVREVYWVVPDRTWREFAGRSALRRTLRKIATSYPGGSVRMRWEHARIRTTVLGRPFVVCSLDTLPEQDEPVLLDIDTDYLTIPRVSYGEWDIPSPLPWRWPSELMSLLQQRRVTTDCATIAYSVEGGYTPIEWKYLGSELVARLRYPQGDPRLSPYEGMRAASLAEHDGNLAAAEAAYRDLGGPLRAASAFRLAHLLAQQGRVDEGRQWYHQTLSLDPSYRSASAPFGLPQFLGRAYGPAARAFSGTLVLDPSDASAHLGLGWLAARRRRWPEAEARARASLASAPESIDALRLLGRALRKQARFADAIVYYERSLVLALAGRRPSDGVIVTAPEGDRLFDASHARAHAVLARLQEQTGEVARAITGYRLAIALGYDEASVRFRLAWIYARQRRWNDALTHASAILRSASQAVVSAVRALMLR